MSEAQSSRTLRYSLGRHIISHHPYCGVHVRCEAVSQVRFLMDTVKRNLKPNDLQGVITGSLLAVCATRSWERR